LFIQWWGNKPDRGAMPNPFDTGPERITLRSWFALLNFKANHRKVVIADREDGGLVAVVASANPHDASSAHSNVALRVEGEIARQMLTSELSVARFSHWTGRLDVPASLPAVSVTAENAAELCWLTEIAIREHLLRALNDTRNGDTVRIGMFYLSDRNVIDALLAAAARGVTVRLILDPNKDAFGRQKDGVPNRPVANELVTQGKARIQVRWYRTHGEQFHTKVALITRGDTLIASLGSANLTRRNLGNYNLEANIALQLPASAALARQMTDYFDDLWSNVQRDEHIRAPQFTAPYGAYEDTDAARYWRYRIMEATGLSTF
jgi:phosphatidylserine/phosphatidylglycerophosphate/cardiolipin synthase-like enzyme